MLTLPETLPSRVLVNKARRIRAAKTPGYENVQSPFEASGETLSNMYKVTLTRPWIILFDLIAFLVALYLSIVYALLYMLFTICMSSPSCRKSCKPLTYLDPIVFQQMRGWNSGVGALPLIGTMVGAFIAGGIVFYESTLQKKKMLAGVKRTPEVRSSFLDCLNSIS